MQIKIVVSRFNENVDWTKQFNNVLIYNKGDQIQGITNINLDNVGREGHTYYKHIYDNYDNLDEFTIFLQGNPFDHTPDVINVIKEYLTNLPDNLMFEYLPSSRMLECNFHNGHGPMELVFNELFGNINGNKTFIFGAGAQFIVNKKKILSRPREFYLKIIQLLSYSSHPIEGFCIERFHNLIFTNN